MAGTTFVWNFASNGDWWDTSHWTPSGFPYTDDTADLSISGAAFTVTMEDGTIQTTGGGSETITGYEVGSVKLGANATLLAETSLLDIQNGATNSGTIIADYQLEVGYTTANAVVSFTSLTSAIGHVVLNGATGATLSGHAAGVELDLHGQSLEGSGTVSQLKLKVFDDARINANVNGQTLTVASGDDILNNGLLEATNGGVLSISSVAIRQAPFASGNLAGVISASDQSTVDLASDTIYGGSVSESGSGVVTMSDNNDTFDGSTTAGAVTFDDGLSSSGFNFVINGAIHNEGVLTAVGGTLYVGASNVTLDSGGASNKGQVTLAGGGLNSIDNTADSQTLTNIDNQIAGFGAISNLILKNQNGVINANVNGQTLSIDSSDTLVNDALIEATNGGNLQVANQTFDASIGSRLSTDASSHISIASDTIRGGNQFANLNFIDNNNVFDGSTNAGAVSLGDETLTNGFNLTLKGTIHNDGELSAAAGSILIDAAGVKLDSAGGPPANSYLYIAGGALNSATNTAQGSALDLVSSQIKGYGVIANLKLTNEYGSSINANTLDDALTIDSSDLLINKGLLEATNGGLLEISSQTLTYQAGVSYMVTAGSKIVIASDTFQGGAFTVTSTGSYSFVDNNNLFDGSTGAGAVTFSQAMDTSGFNVTWNGAIHNKGAFAVHAGTVEIGASGVTLDSGGAAIKGQILLAGGNVNSAADTAASGALDDVDNQIGGCGGLYNLKLTLESGAKINANVSGQTLAIDSSDQLINKGLVEATNGGILDLYSQTLAYQTGAAYMAAAGSKIVLASDTFQGGALTAAVGGAYAFVDNNTLFDGSTGAGAVTLAQGMDTSGFNATLSGAIHNKGAFAVHGGTLEIGASSVKLDSGGAATKGQVVVAGGAVNSVANTAASGSLDNVDNQIVGYGSLYNLSLTNEISGVVNASTATKTLSIDSSDSVTNKGTLEATAGFLSLTGGTINNAGGTILANGGEVDLRSVTVTRGNLEGLGASSVHIADSNVLLDASNVSNGLMLFGNVIVNTGQTVTMDGSVVNKGVLKLAANAALTLGDSSGTAATLTNAAGAVLNIAGNFGVSHGTSTGSKILNSGLIQKSAGAGLSIISTSISGSGGVEDDIGALDLTGASNVLSGALTGVGKIDFSGGGSTTLASGVSASVSSLYMFDTGTTVRLQTSLSYGGTFTQAGNTSLTLSPNVTLTLTGTSSLGGTIFGSANLVMTGGSATLTPTAAITTTTWVSTGTALTFSGAHTYSGTFSATSETMTLSGLLKFAGAATLTGVTLKGTNQAQFGKGATLAGGLTLGGTTSVVNYLSVAQSGGNVVLGDSTGGVTKLINTGASTTWAFTDDFGVALGNSAASSINNTGIFEKTGGGGVSTIAAAVTNAGKLEALSGVLDVKGAVAGKGADIVSGASTLEFDSTVAGTQTVMFQGAGGVLDLTNWGAFSGAVSGFDTVGTNDMIDVSGPWNWVGFNQSAGVLAFVDGATQHSVKLTGSYLAADFHHSVVGGVTQVTYG